jgi:uncharacterized RDD family membrane protein YckC
MICRNHLDVSEGVRRCSRCGGTFCNDCLVTIQGQPFCAVCKSEQLLDVRSGVDRMHIVYGSILKRFGSMFLDGIIQALPMYAVFFGVFAAAGMFSGKEPNPFIILLAYPPLLAIPVLYEALMLSMKNGQTIGKMALNLRVVRMDGSKITTGQAWGRAGMRLVMGLICGGIADYIPAFFTDEKTTLHDLVAGTRVIDVQ